METKRVLLVVFLAALAAEPCCAGVAHAGEFGSARGSLEAATAFLQTDENKNSKHPEPIEKGSVDEEASKLASERKKPRRSAEDAFKDHLRPRTALTEWVDRQKQSPIETSSVVYIILLVCTFIVYVFSLFATSTRDKADMLKGRRWLWLLVSGLVSFVLTLITAFMGVLILRRVNSGDRKNVPTRYLTWMMMILMVNFIVMSVCEELLLRENTSWEGPPVFSLFAFGGVLVWHFSLVYQSHVQMLKLICYPVLTHMLLWVLFAFLYYAFAKDYGAEGPDGKIDSALKDFTDALYFSAITQTTVGYGDVPNHTKRAKMLSSAHAILVFLLGTLNAFNMIKGFEEEEAEGDESLSGHALDALRNGNAVLKALSLTHPELLAKHPHLFERQVASSKPTEAEKEAMATKSVAEDLLADE